MRSAPASAGDTRAAYYERLRPQNLAPLWEVLSALVTPAPRTRAVAAAWSFANIEPVLMEAGELISAAEAQRRVLILENPALPGESRITQTLYAGLQLILPGEVAPAHRHTQNALRFIMSGDGAFTALNGERTLMRQYDLILTPNMIWHDHGNETRQPMIWLDGLDIPLVQMLDGSFAEHRADGGVCPTVASSSRASAALRPTRGVEGHHLRDIPGPETRPNPLLAYPHSEWRARLEELRASESPHAHDAHLLEFVNPADDGPVMSTISAFARLVPAGFVTRSMRSTDGMIHVVVEGSGTLTIDGKDFPLRPGEIVVSPCWCRRVISADSDLVLFSYSDRAAQQKLGLWREQLA